MAILADEHTRVIVQGITGREATSFTKDMIDYGTKVVAGITPGKGGQRVHGIPVYDTIRQALREHPAEAAVISVPPALVKGAVLEALENGITLAVVVSERVPRKDTIEFLEVAKARNARVIGPNTLGLISPGKVRLGMAGGPAADVRKAYMPGPVGIASRSGGMTTEIANLLTTRGIGQSTCIGIGGDPVVGSNFLDLIPLFDRDPETKVVVLFSEPGGVIEEKLSECGHDREAVDPDHRFHRRPICRQHAGSSFWPCRHDCRGESRHHEEQNRDVSKGRNPCGRILF